MTQIQRVLSECQVDAKFGCDVAGVKSQVDWLSQLRLIGRTCNCVSQDLAPTAESFTSSKIAPLLSIPTPPKNNETFDILVADMKVYVCSNIVVALLKAITRDGAVSEDGAVSVPKPKFKISVSTRILTYSITERKNIFSARQQIKGCVGSYCARSTS